MMVGREKGMKVMFNAPRYHRGFDIYALCTRGNGIVGATMLSFSMSVLEGFQIRCLFSSLIFWVIG